MSRHGATTANISLFTLYLLLVSYIFNAYTQDGPTQSPLTFCDTNGRNGVCDDELNNEECDFDGGDCCPCTCSDCSDVDCLDPDASQQLYDCEDAPSSFPPCVGGVETLMVENTTQASALADAVKCSGGVFHVWWKGKIIVDESIWVFNGTFLNVTGVGLNAEMDGNGSTRLLTVVNASLHMSSTKVSNGNATGGGAIAASGSTLIVNHTVFAGNVASKDGGAFFTSEGSVVSFDGAIEFLDNNASSGGALYITALSNSCWAGVTTFTGNVGGAVSVRNGSMASWEAGATFSGQVGEAALGVHGGSVVRWARESTFSNNTDRALLVRGGSIATWSGLTSFSGNNYSGDGGAIYVEDGGNVSWMGATTFSHNNASRGGALSAKNNSFISWSATTNFSHNIAHQEGGALYVDGECNVSWTEATFFLHNNAPKGGALFARGGASISWIAVTIFSENVASEGGAIFVSEGGVISWIAVTNFSENVASEGGAIFVGEGGVTSWAGEVVFFRNNAAFGGGAVSVLGGEIIWSNTTYFDTNYVLDFDRGVGQGGALFIGNRGYASWTGETVFSNNSAGGRGGGVFVTRASTLEWSGETNFTSNRAGSDGGAVGTDDFHQRIITSSTYSPTVRNEQSSLLIGGKTHFINNNSSGSGGGMALLCSVNATFLATEIVFIRNSAASSGGGIFISATDNGPVLSGVDFVSNTARAGGGVYATATGTIVDGCRFADNRAEESGGAIHSIAGVESFADTYFRRNKAQIGGALMLSGTAKVSNCSFLENVSDVDSGPAVYNIGSLSALNKCSFLDNIFDCDKGTYFSFNEGGQINEAVCAGCSCNECDQCEDCRYGNIERIPTCETALDHTKSTGGTIEELVIEAGYWRATNDSTTILECYYAKACNGGVTGDPDYCTQGYEGAYCSVCSKTFSPGLGKTCTKCSDSMVGILLAIGLGVLGAVVGVIVAFHLVSGEKEGAGRGIVGRISRIVPLHTLKIVVVAWQILTQFAVVAHVTYPDAYQHFLDVVNMVNLDLSWVIAIECVVRFNFHGKMVFSTMGPLAILGFLGITYCVAVRAHGGNMEALRSVWQKHLSVVLLLTFFVYSSVSAVLFQMFDCEELDNGKIYLRADYSIECNTAWHRALMVYSAVMMLLYPVGIPSFYAYLLFKNRDVLADSGLRATEESVQLTSDLWKPYKPSRFYYEVIECGRRLLLTAGVLLVDDDTSAQVAVVLMVAVSFALLLEILAPYESRIDTWVSRTGHAVVYGSMYFALLQKTEISNETQASQKVFEWVLITTHALMVAAVAIDAVALAYSSSAEIRTKTSERVFPVDDFSGIESSTWRMRTQPQACLNPRRQARLGRPL